MKHLGTLVKNKLTEIVWVYLCIVKSIPIIYMSLVIPVVYHLVALITSFVVSFEIEKFELSNFVVNF